MTAQLSPTPVQKFFNNNGLPLVKGKLYTYAAGTSDPQATYVDSTQTTENTNPVEMNFRGECNLWLDPALTYKFVLRDAFGFLIWTVDNIPGGFGALPVSTSLIPNPTNTFTLGDPTHSWAQIYLGANAAPAYDPMSGNIGYYARTAAEISANVTPTDFVYQPGDVRRYGAVGNGTADDSTAFARGALVCGIHPMLIPYTSTGYKIVTPFALPTNATIIGFGKPQLFATVNGTHICSCVSGSEITVSGVRFLGTSSSTVPLNGFGGFAAANTGLLTCANCTDVRITDCEFSTFYCGITAEGSTRVWINRNMVSTFQNTGVMLSLTTNFDVELNDISNCTQTGGVVAYGVQCTGDNAGGSPSRANSISFNRINGIPSWDGIGSHDIDGLRVIGNDIRNVRTGVDLGHANNTTLVSNLTVCGNYIEATTTDTWGGVAAASAGVAIVGFDATHRVSGAVIADNTINHFFQILGAAYTGQSHCIVVTHADDAIVSGNEVKGIGSGGPNSGVYSNGTVNRLAVTGNALQGVMGHGAIRLESVTADVISISGNAIKQDTASNQGVLITTSTVGALMVSNNPTNSTTPYADDAPSSTLGFVGSTPRSTCTVTLSGGTATTPTGTIIYQINNDIVTLEIPTITATSNATTQPVLTGLPANLIPVDIQHCIGMCQDNSGTVISQIRVDNSGGTLTLFNGTNSTFTASNNKGVINCTITYRRAA